MKDGRRTRWPRRPTTPSAPARWSGSAKARSCSSGTPTAPAVITEAGDLPQVAGLVHVAAFTPDAGESPGRISQEKPTEAFDTIAPDSDGYLWIKQDEFHESFCQDLPVDLIAQAADELRG
ncbi:hypothetical protein [Streptomyces flavofungini]|uniref:hypothetical protein n=1 Tax=Streptomyces flavofungini TaxID=68200 RepID=UPI0025B23D62|nr:hypothetical protein [Streptomyces flavofungini]WJV51643.1 hypothetical protein QUY26_38320 [Streptomyces flavofungini]